MHEGEITERDNQIFLRERGAGGERERGRIVRRKKARGRMQAVEGEPAGGPNQALGVRVLGAWKLGHVFFFYFIIFF